MATLGTINLGIVKSESSSKESNLIFQAIPYSDSDKAITLDLMGTTRTLTISGEKVDTPTNLVTFISNIETAQNGQQTGLTYTGDMISGITVFIQSFSWDYVSGDPNRISYTLTLYEGDNG